jgi:hypothetical protein
MNALSHTTVRTHAFRSVFAAAATVGFIALPLAAHAQSAAPSKQDVLYDTQTQANGSCPAMAWHVVVHADQTLNGMVSWDQAKHLAHLTGSVGKDGAFKVNAVEQGSNKTDTVTGSIHGNNMKASISGTGTGCDNQTMNVPMTTNASTSG